MHQTSIMSPLDKHRHSLRECIQPLTVASPSAASGGNVLRPKAVRRPTAAPYVVADQDSGQQGAAAPAALQEKKLKPASDVPPPRPPKSATAAAAATAFIPAKPEQQQPSHHHDPVESRMEPAQHPPSETGRQQQQEEQHDQPVQRQPSASSPSNPAQESPPQLYSPRQARRRHHDYQLRPPNHTKKVKRTPPVTLDHAIYIRPLTWLHTTFDTMLAQWQQLIKAWCAQVLDMPWTTDGVVAGDVSTFSRIDEKASNNNNKGGDDGTDRDEAMPLISVLSLPWPHKTIMGAGVEDHHHQGHRRSSSAVSDEQNEETSSHHTWVPSDTDKCFHQCFCETQRHVQKCQTLLDTMAQSENAWGTNEHGTSHYSLSEALQFCHQVAYQRVQQLLEYSERMDQAAGATRAWAESLLPFLARELGEVRTMLSHTGPLTQPALRQLRHTVDTQLATFLQFSQQHLSQEELPCERAIDALKTGILQLLDQLTTLRVVAQQPQYQHLHRNFTMQLRLLQHHPDPTVTTERLWHLVQTAVRQLETLLSVAFAGIPAVSNKISNAEENSGGGGGATTALIPSLTSSTTTTTTTTAATCVMLEHYIQSLMVRERSLMQQQPIDYELVSQTQDELAVQEAHLRQLRAAVPRVSASNNNGSSSTASIAAAPIIFPLGGTSSGKMSHDDNDDSVLGPVVSAWKDLHEAFVFAEPKILQFLDTRQSVIQGSMEKQRYLELETHKCIASHVHRCQQHGIALVEAAGGMVLQEIASHESIWEHWTAQYQREADTLARIFEKNLTWALHNHSAFYHLLQQFKHDFGKLERSMHMYIRAMQATHVAALLAIRRPPTPLPAPAQPEDTAMY